MSLSLEQHQTLNTGAKMPTLGFGTWQAKPGEVATAVRIAAEHGFRHFDCATVYHNEAEIGEVFNDIINVKKAVKREDLFIVTKLWNTAHAADDVEVECRKSLQRLQLDYVDLYLMHWPVSLRRPEGGEYKSPSDLFPFNGQGGMHQGNVPLHETWLAMEKLVEKGLVKAIGVSNFSLEQIDSLKANGATIVPATNQVECHPACNQNDLRVGLKERGITLTSYCPLGLGFEGSSQDGGVMAHPVLADISKMAGTSTVAELMLRWNLQKGNIVLTKSVTPSRIETNAKTPFGGLSDEVMAAIEEFGQKYPRRVCNPTFFRETEGAYFQ